MSNDQLHDTSGTNLSVSDVSLGVAGVAWPLSGGTPALKWSANSLASGSVIEIETDGTYDFGTKPNSPKPLFYWDADGGQQPSALGRLTAWSDSFNGEVDNTIVMQGKSQSIAYDHFDSAHALGQIPFTSDQVYMHRQKYDDFDVTTDGRISTEISSLTGTLEVGQTVTGATSGATGIIQSFTSGRINYDSTGGTINDNPSIDFVTGETLSTATATATNTEGFYGGLWRTFNYKIVRFWADANNQYMGTQGVESPFYRFTVENTNQSTVYTNTVRQLPREWVSEEFIYESSSIDLADGRFDYLQNGRQAHIGGFNHRTTALPNKFNRAYQLQVSNGTQPNCKSFYAGVYLDDSYCRVVVHDAPTLTMGTLDIADTYIQPLPPTEWLNGKLKVIAVGDVTGKYYSAINANNQIVATGRFL